MLDPYLYILHAGPLFIHTSCWTPIYTYFMLYPYLYILHAVPLFIYTSCWTPIYTYFMLYPYFYDYIIIPSSIIIVIIHPLEKATVFFACAIRDSWFG